MVVGMEKVRFKTCSRNRIYLWIGPGDREIKNDTQVFLTEPVYK